MPKSSTKMHNYSTYFFWGFGAVLTTTWKNAGFVSIGICPRTCTHFWDRYNKIFLWLNTLKSQLGWMWRSELLLKPKSFRKTVRLVVIIWIKHWWIKMCTIVSLFFREIHFSTWCSLSLLKWPIQKSFSWAEQIPFATPQSRYSIHSTIRGRNSILHHGIFRGVVSVIWFTYLFIRW